MLAREGRVPSNAASSLDINGGNQHYATGGLSREGHRRRSREIERNSPIGGDRDPRSGARYDRGLDLADSAWRAVDWVIVPSTWWEVFGLVVSEAWLFGRPVIASAIGGLDERVTQDVDGVKVPARDAAALADRMASMVGDETLWRQLNAGITPPWNNVAMFDAYVTLWQDARTAARNT